MDSLVIYDTSNYIDFPIGGQITSIQNFLSYIAEFEKEISNKVFLVGVTNNKSQIGKITTVIINHYEFKFLAVVYRDENLNNVQKSLRLEFLKGLFKYRNIIPNSKNTVHYLHTPEAFIQVKVCHPLSKIAVFSHGSFYNMVNGFRFYQNNKFVPILFNRFIQILIKNSNLIFCLDNISLDQYKKFNSNVIKVNNSIILPNEIKPKRIVHNPVELVYIGRLSKVKRVDKLIEVFDGSKEFHLTIVGDGEESDRLKSLVKSNNISFEGAVKPNLVKKYIINSDILIMNSCIEGKPMTILEAISYGLPVVTTDVGGIGEMLNFGLDSEKTNGSKDSICSALDKIINNFEIYSQYAIENSKQFDYVTINKKICFELNKLI